MENFKGKDIGYISRDTKPTINGLVDEEIEKVTQSIFSSKDKKGSVKLFDKSVVYKITDSKFVPYNSNNDYTVISAVGDVKTNLISSSLLEKLKNKYDVKSYMGSN